MSTQIRLRRGTAAQHATFTGAAGEVTINTTDNTLRVHDGVTPGGVPGVGGGSNNRADHFGTQLASTISDFAASVLATVLTGLSLASSAAVTAADSVLVAIGKLQAQVSLRALLTSNTFTGAQVFSDQQVSRAMLIDSANVFVDKGNSSTTAQTLDFTAGSHQRLAVTGAFTLSTSNWPPSGNMGEILLELVNGAAFAITWPTINWVKSDGTTTTVFASNGVTLQASGIDWVLLWSRDAGTTIYGKIMR